MVNKSVTAELTMLNPLPEMLGDCSFTIEGISLTEGKPITQKYVNFILTVRSGFVHQLFILAFLLFLLFSVLWFYLCLMYNN